MTWTAILGALLMVAATPAYLHHTVHGPTRPHPLSWGIWTTLGILGTTATAVAGGGPAVLVLGVTAALDLLIFIVAIRQHRGQMSRYELWPIVPALFGVAVWAISSNPLAGALGVILADTCGAWPTLKKTWAEPRSEPPLLWAMSSVAFLLSVISVPEVTLATVAYPAYLTFATALVALVAWARRDRVAPPLAPGSTP